MSNLQTYYHLKLDFQKVDQHTGGKWLIHDTKRRRDNQLQSQVLLNWHHFNAIVNLHQPRPMNSVGIMRECNSVLPVPNHEFIVISP